MPTASEAFELLNKHYTFNTVLDLGCGNETHARNFLKLNKQVTTVDHQPRPPIDNENLTQITGDMFEAVQNFHLSRAKFDCIWMSHVLEHSLDPHNLLCYCREILTDDGVIAITVPPLKHSIVGGHVNLFNQGLLLYRMVLAWFDCSEARIGAYGYNISLIVRKKTIKQLPPLTMDYGDLELLKDFMPTEGKLKQNVDGRLPNINWKL